MIKKGYIVSLGHLRQGVKEDGTVLMGSIEDHLRYEKRFSEQNVHNHMINIRRLIRDFKIVKPCIEDAHRIEELLRADGLGDTTIRSYLRALELIAEYQGEPLTLKKPKRHYKVIESLSLAEARVLLNSFDTVRDQAIGAIFLYCLLRVGEVVRLDVGDISLERREIHVKRTKNRHDRRAIIPPDAEKYIKAWIALRQDVPV